MGLLCKNQNSCTSRHVRPCKLLTNCPYKKCSYSHNTTASPLLPFQPPIHPPHPYSRGPPDLLYTPPILPTYHPPSGLPHNPYLSLPGSTPTPPPPPTHATPAPTPTGTPLPQPPTINSRELDTLKISVQKLAKDLAAMRTELATIKNNSEVQSPENGSTGNVRMEDEAPAVENILTISDDSPDTNAGCAPADSQEKDPNTTPTQKTRANSNRSWLPTWSRAKKHSTPNPPPTSEAKSDTGIGKVLKGVSTDKPPNNNHQLEETDKKPDLGATLTQEESMGRQAAGITQIISKNNDVTEDVFDNSPNIANQEMAERFNNWNDSMGRQVAGITKRINTLEEHMIGQCNNNDLTAEDVFDSFKTASITEEIAVIQHYLKRRKANQKKVYAVEKKKVYARERELSKRINQIKTATDANTYMLNTIVKAFQSTQTHLSDT